MIIKLTQGYEAIIDDADYDLIKGHSWCVTINSNIAYATCSIQGKGVLMHRLIMGIYDSKILIDHEDNDGLNNRRNNLRIATHQENGRNRRKQKGRASKYLGVHLNTIKKKLKSGQISTYQYWSAYIYINGKNTYLGCGKNEIEAAKLYDKHALIHFKQFANLNFKSDEQPKI